MIFRDVEMCLDLPAACLCRRASLSMLNASSDWSSMSAPGHGEPVRQRRERAEEAGLALGGGVRGELVSWGSRREPSRSRSFCMFEARKGRGGEIRKVDWWKKKKHIQTVYQ